MKRALLILPALLVSAGAGATVLEAWDTQRLVREAESVVVAKVLDHRSLSLDGRNIVTDTRIRVERYLLGSGHRNLTIRQWGGQMGQRRIIVAGNAQLASGSEVVLFLMNVAGRQRVVGMAQGAYEIHAGMAMRMLDVPLYKNGRVHKVGLGSRSLPLDELMGEIRSAKRAAN